MIDLEGIERLAHKLAELYQGVELAVLLMVTRQIKRDLMSKKRASPQLGDSRTLSMQTQRIVAKLQRSRAPEIAGLIAGAHTAGARLAAKQLRGAGISATLAPLESEASTSALVRDLSGRLSSTDRRILRSADDAYQGVIARVTAQGLAGEHTRHGAAQAALNLFADRGITGFLDAAGKSWNLASYTEMATRTAAIRAGRQGTIDEVRAAGRDLVVVGGSPSCCPLCAPWEGEVLSLDGKTPDHPTLAEAEAAGLFHPNCGHRVDPYVEGLTDTSTVKHGDPERYEARQEQRRLERGVRHYKHREAASLDELAHRRAAGKTREWQGRLREHVAEHDLKRLRYREQVKKAI